MAQLRHRHEGVWTWGAQHPCAVQEVNAKLGLGLRVQLQHLKLEHANGETAGTGREGIS